MSTTNSRRLTAGFAIDWTVSAYHMTLIKGTTDAARDYDVNEIIYIGGNLTAATQLEMNKNIIYNYITSDLINGLLISAATIKRFSSRDEMSKFCYQFSPFPIVTIAEEIKGIPCVETDNTTGIRDMLFHLIHDHKYRRFAFIKGTKGNTDAEQRFQVFEKILADEGLELDEELVFEGSFIFESGVEAMNKLLDGKKLDCDVIFAANDQMARGAISCLQQHHYKVPGDIAVVGFDNEEICEFLSIPLTTVEQPIYQQGYKAMELLVSLMKGEKAPDRISLPTRFIRRASCGCTDTRETRYFSKPVPKKKTSKNAAGIMMTDIVTRINKTFKITDPEEKKEIKKMIQALATSIEKEEEDDFLDEVDRLLSYPLSFIRKGYSIKQMFSIIRERVIDEAGDDERRRSFLHHILEQASLSFAEQFERDIRYFQIVEEREINFLRENIEELVAFLDRDNLTNALTQYLPTIGIQSCFLSIYEEEAVGEYPVLSRLILAFNEKGRIRIEKDGRLFPTKKLTPEGLLPSARRFTITVEDLFFGQTQLGLCLFEFTQQDTSLWELARREFVLVALKAAMYVQVVQRNYLTYEKKVNARTEALSKANELLARLYEERKKAEAEVRLLNEELEKRVQERTSELEKANFQLQDTLKRLKTAQSKLVQSEKMAALGGLVAGIAHEINTPIGIGVTAASHLDKITKELSTLYQNQKLKRSDLEHYFTTSTEASSLILSNMKRAYDLIRSFKKIAVDQSSEEKRRFNVREYCEEVILSLKPKLKKTEHTISLQIDKNLEIYSYPGAFSQILTNFILNSLIHGFFGKDKGKIIVKASLFKEMFFFRYFDNGKGIPRSVQKKIFDPFFTTSRAQGGTGLGLHLVYNIVTQTLRGTIRCKSYPSYGALFIISIPYKEVDPRLYGNMDNNT
ncbi:MAG: substrate-binding domain-containing protein [Spirochaetales bacterium]|nr:substrate-binding domain-containing protein [Spirochaetales bacterium]